MDIHVSTLYEWKNRYPDINEALKKGKDIFDNEVEESLFKSAGGYYVEETKTYVTESDGKRKKHIETVKKYIQPNVTAQIFWLKNRRPELWRDRNEMEIDGGDQVIIIDDVREMKKQLEDDVNGKKGGDTQAD